MQRNELIDFILQTMRNSSGTAMSIKRIISGKYGNDYESSNYELRQAIQSELLEKEIIVRTPTGEYMLTPKGHSVAAIGDYSMWLQQQDEKSENNKEIENLTKQKLDLDIKNAKRVYDSYWITFALSIAAFLISLSLLAIKLIESANK